MNYYAIYSENGIILSYKPFIKAEAIIVSSDHVIGFGPREKVEEMSSKLNAEQIYVDKTILPAFIDAHLHIDALGFELSTIDLVDVNNREELLEKLRNTKPNIGEWIVGGRFDHLLFPDQRPPTRRELDNIDSQHPILLIHRSGHMGVLNTRGLKYMRQYIKEYVDWENGWVFESSLWIIREKIFNILSQDFIEELLVKAQDHLLENGILAIGIAGCNDKVYESLMRLDSEKKLWIRTYLYMYLNDPSDLVNIWHKYLESRKEKSRVVVNGIKIFVDGALGPRTAYLSKPYNDDPCNKGKLLCDIKCLEEIISKASKYGLQIAIHAIGDAALDIVLETYSKYVDIVKLYRYRIEHASIIRDDQLGIINRVKPVIVVQPHFIITDKWIIDRVGIERVKYVYRFKTLYNMVPLSFSTDAPVEPVNPWKTIYAAITRGIREKLEHGLATEHEKLSLLEALNAYTRGSAYALSDDKLGCLLPGCYPDMILVDKNPLEIREPSELLDIKIEPFIPWL